MNKTYLYLTAVWLAGSFVPCGAQTDGGDNKPPSPPYLATVAAPGSWTVQVKLDQSPSAAAPNSGAPAAGAVAPLYTKEIQVTKTEDKKRMVLTSSDSTVSEVWYANNYVLYRQPNFAADEVAIAEQVPGLSSLLGVGDFPTLSWIDIKTYKRRESHDGSSCFYFESSPVGNMSGLPAGAGKSRTVPIRKAWIDVKTKLPVAFDDGVTIQEYTFSPGGPKTLTLPPLYQKNLDDYLAQRK
jgi:hypothetical protein